MNIQERIENLERELEDLKDMINKTANKHILATYKKVRDDDSVLELELGLEGGETYIRNPDGSDCFCESDEGYDANACQWLLWGFVDRLAAKGLLNDIKHES
jgi:hypothetical protein